MSMTRNLLIGAGAVIVGQLIVFNQLDAYSYLHVRGYIDGLMRASGDGATAQAELDAWRSYWIDKVWWKGLVDHFYNYGLNRIGVLYGN